MAFYDTSLIKAFDNSVLETKLENQLITKLDMNQFITLDYSLVETPGMFKEIRTYHGNGNVEDLAMGEGNTQKIGSYYTTETYRVDTTQGQTEYFDEQAMSDPKAVDTAVNYISTQLTNDVTEKVVKELAKATIVKYNATFSYADIVAARGLFPDENNEGVFMLVSIKDVPKIMISLEASLKYVEGYIRSDYIGSIAGMPIYSTKALNEGEAFIATREAVTCFMKKGVEVEQVRDADHRKNTVIGRNVKVIALTNADKVVRMTTGAAPSTTVTVETLNTNASASISGQKVVVSGNDVIPGVPSAFAQTFPLPLNDGVIVQLKGIIPASGATIVQENNGLKEYYGSDASIEKKGVKYIKTKSYDGSDPNYELIVEAGGKATVKVGNYSYQVEGKFNLAD